MAIEIKLNDSAIEFKLNAITTTSSGIPALAAYYDDNITPVQYEDLTYAEYEA